MRTIFIAEIGENHLGDIRAAKDLIKNAAYAGADYVKFQSYTQNTFQQSDPEYDWFKKVALSNEAHIELMETARRNNVRFLTAPFDMERARFVCEELKLTEIKVASAMLLNFKMLDYFNSIGVETLFISTGMAVLPEIEQSLQYLRNIPHIYLLHCVTQYPCSDNEANLRAITALQQRFNLPVGYSDHTIGIDACVSAAALGAIVIEKHFTFDKSCTEGTDHILSATPDDFKDMVAKIRRVELFLGDGNKKPSHGERQIMDFVRNRFSKNE